MASDQDIKLDPDLSGEGLPPEDEVIDLLRKPHLPWLTRVLYAMGPLGVDAGNLVVGMSPSNRWFEFQKFLF